MLTEVVSKKDLARYWRVGWVGVSLLNEFLRGHLLGSIPLFDLVI